MKLSASPYFSKKYAKLVRHQPHLSTAIDRKLKLFTKNQNHPSLKLHKLTGKKINEWSLSVKGNLRIIFQYTQDEIVLVDIGTHDQVY